MSIIRESHRPATERRLRRGQAALGAMEALTWATGAGIVIALAHGLVEVVGALGWAWYDVAWVTLISAAILGAGFGYYDHRRR